MIHQVATPVCASVLSPAAPTVLFPHMARYVFDPSWLGDVPPPQRPLLLFDGG
jgi:hypothetical protein